MRHEEVEPAALVCAVAVPESALKKSFDKKSKVLSHLSHPFSQTVGERGGGSPFPSFEEVANRPHPHHCRLWLEQRVAYVSDLPDVMAAYLVMSQQEIRGTSSVVSFIPLILLPPS